MARWAGRANLPMARAVPPQAFPACSFGLCVSVDHFSSTLKALESLLRTASQSLLLTGNGQAEDLWTYQVTVCS